MMIILPTRELPRRHCCTVLGNWKFPEWLVLLWTASKWRVMENFQIVKVICTFGDYILFKISWFFKKIFSCLPETNQRKHNWCHRKTEYGVHFIPIITHSHDLGPNYKILTLLHSGNFFTANIFYIKSKVDNLVTKFDPNKLATICICYSTVLGYSLLWQKY